MRRVGLIEQQILDHERRAGRSIAVRRAEPRHRNVGKAGSAVVRPPKHAARRHVDGRRGGRVYIGALTWCRLCRRPPMLAAVGCSIEAVARATVTCGWRIESDATAEQRVRRRAPTLYRWKRIAREAIGGRLRDRYTARRVGGLLPCIAPKERSRPAGERCGGAGEGPQRIWGDSVRA